MKKVKILRLSKDAKQNLLRQFIELSPDRKKHFESAEDYMTQNDNQTALVVNQIANSQAWEVNDDAYDMRELRKQLNEFEGDEIILEDKYVNLVIKSSKKAKIHGSQLEIVLDVVDLFKSAENYDPNKKVLK